MAPSLRSMITFFIHLLLLANYHFFATDARILNILKPISSPDYAPRLSFGAIKKSGGHYTSVNVQTLGRGGHDHKFMALGEVKKSGPSPGGVGHKFNKVAQSLGGVKESGPSPGNGHSFITNQHN